jgi:hypothetical protein
MRTYGAMSGQRRQLAHLPTSQRLSTALGPTAEPSSCNGGNPFSALRVSFRQALRLGALDATAYSDSLNATAIACLNHARAWFMACRTARSSDRGRNLSTFRDAACNASEWSTSARNRSRSFRLMDLQWAVTSATMSINAALGSGNSGSGSNSGTTQRGRPEMNGRLMNVVTGTVIPDHLMASARCVGCWS